MEVIPAGRERRKWTLEAKARIIAAYLADVLARIVTRRDGEPIDDLLPGNWVDKKAAEMTFETSVIATAA